MVPRGGIEPPTRGFSVPFSPSQAARFTLGTSAKGVWRPVKPGWMRHSQAQSLRTIPGAGVNVLCEVS